MSDEMMKMPEPDHYLDSGSTPFYTADQMRAYAQEATRQAMEDQFFKLKAHIEAERDAHQMFRNHAAVIALESLIDLIDDELRSLLSDLDARGKK